MGSFGLDVDLVHVAPQPILARLPGSHDRMLPRGCVRARVSVGRGVAAAHRAAGHAHPEVHPRVAGREAFGAAVAVGANVVDRAPMRAADGAGVDGREWMLGDQAQAEARSAAECRLDGDRPAVLLGHVLHDRQAEAGAGRPAG